MSDPTVAESVDRLEFRYDITYDDLRAVRKYAKSHLPDGKPKPRTSKFVWVWLVFFIGMMIFFVATARVRQEPPRPQPAEAVNGDAEAEPPPGLSQYYPLIGFVSFLGVVFVWAHFQVGKQLRKLADGPDYKNQVCTITAQGATFTGTDVCTAFRWPKFRYLVLTKQHLLFSISETLVHVVPRRAIGDAEQVIRTLAYLRKWYSGPIIDEEGQPLTTSNSLALN